MDTSRGAVPATFPVDGCVDGGGIWIRNTQPVPIRLRLGGSTGTPKTVRAANATLAADAMWIAQGSRNTLVAPGQTTFVPVGTGAASVTVTTDTAATNTYLVADGLVSLIGAAKLKGAAKQTASGTAKANAAASFVSELTAVYQNYRNCLGAKPSILTQTKCGARLSWDVSFAATRFGLKLGPQVIGLAIDAIKTWKLVFSLNSILNAIEAGNHTITLSGVVAATPLTISPLGYGPVRFGMTVAEAERALGTSINVTESVNNCGFWSFPQLTTKRSLWQAVELDGRMALFLVPPKVVADSGIKVGDSLTRLRSTYAGRLHMIQTPTLMVAGPGGTPLPEYGVDEFRAGVQYTLAFRVRNGEVVAMSAGRWSVLNEWTECA